MSFNINTIHHEHHQHTTTHNLQNQNHSFKPLIYQLHKPIGIIPFTPTVQSFNQHTCAIQNLKTSKNIILIHPCDVKQQIMQEDKLINRPDQSFLKEFVPELIPNQSKISFGNSYHTMGYILNSQNINDCLDDNRGFNYYGVPLGLGLFKKNIQQEPQTSLYFKNLNNDNLLHEKNIIGINKKNNSIIDNKNNGGSSGSIEGRERGGGRREKEDNNIVEPVQKSKRSRKQKEKCGNNSKDSIKGHDDEEEGIINISSKSLSRLKSIKDVKGNQPLKKKKLNRFKKPAKFSTNGKRVYEISRFFVKNYIGALRSALNNPNCEAEIKKFVGIDSNGIVKCRMALDKLLIEYPKHNRLQIYHLIKNKILNPIFQYFLRCKVFSWIYASSKMIDKKSHLLARKNFLYLCLKANELTPYNFRIALNTK